MGHQSVIRAFRLAFFKIFSKSKRRKSVDAFAAPFRRVDSLNRFTYQRQHRMVSNYGPKSAQNGSMLRDRSGLH
jgi:hypothetical protein